MPKYLPSPDMAVFIFLTSRFYVKSELTKNSEEATRFLESSKQREGDNAS